VRLRWLFVATLFEDGVGLDEGIAAPSSLGRMRLRDGNESPEQVRKALVEVII